MITEKVSTATRVDNLMQAYETRELLLGLKSK